MGTLRTRVGAGYLPAIALLFGAIIGTIFFFVRPGDPPLPAQDDTAALWSESMSRLGIEPLYPPQEDFHVGDLYAVVSAYDDDDGVTKEKGPNRPLLRKSVRIAHLNLRPISLGNPVTPRFATTKMEGTEAVLDQDREEVDASPITKITVSLVSFPSITIRNGSSSSASWTDILPFGADRTLEHEEVITIKIAESYEADPVAATAMFGKWCKEGSNVFACSDQFARKIIGYVVDNDVLDVRRDKYVYRISLKLITKVYMTRHLEFRRHSNGKVGASLGRAPGHSAANAETTDTSSEQGASIDSRDEIDLGFSNLIYPRPVVFGFKAATFALEPSTPESPLSQPSTTRSMQR